MDNSMQMWQSPGKTTQFVASRWQRIRRAGIRALLLGWFYRRHCTRAGFIAIAPEWPLPKIDNRGGTLEIGNCGLFPGVRIECWKGATVIIGNGTYLNRNTEIVAGQAVQIGRDCKIARDVLIMDNDQHPIGNRPLGCKPVYIGDRVWIGARAIILKGVTIGADAIVGAGTVVTKDVPPGGIIVGPASRLLKHEIT